MSRRVWRRPHIARQFFVALWNAEERGRTADLLAQLDKEVGEDLIRLSMWQAWFWRQQHLYAKARKRLMALVARFPDRPASALDLAGLFAKEKWQEDRCAVLESLDARWPKWTEVRLQLAVGQDRAGAGGGAGSSNQTDLEVACRK